MPSKIDPTSKFLKTVADTNRLKILIFIKDSPKCVCEIFPFLKVSQKLASHHLSQLRKVGLVKQEKKGNFIYYSINKKALKKQLKLLNKFLNH